MILDPRRIMRKSAVNGQVMAWSDEIRSWSPSSGGITNAGDIQVSNASKGLVLKDTQGTPHFWRITVSNVGAIVITDLGTTAPV